MNARRIEYTIEGYYSDLRVEIEFSNNVKIPDEAINKVLGIAMNYLLENMEIEEKESAE